MNSTEIRQKFLKFYEAHGHKVVPSSSLIPENDPSVLFTTAGMQQFKPYYVGVPSPFGNRVASVQKCLRTSDIDEVGDASHLTFFEMLGNFSFAVSAEASGEGGAGYFKEEAIKLVHEFVTKEMNLKIDYVTVFEGEGIVPADDESAIIWQNLDPKIIVKKFGRADNFWGPTGEEGPCGPTTEIYVDGIEIWNIVFNEYFQVKDGSLSPLKTKGIDTGMGLERLAKVSQKVETVFETDLFDKFVSSLPKDLDVIKKRILADHARSSAFLITDGIRPSNKERGYILRRLLRRILAQSGIENLKHAIDWVTTKYKDVYPELDQKLIMDVIEEEWNQFSVALDLGLKELNKIEKIDTKSAFHIFTTYGLPFDIIKDKFPELSKEEFDKEFHKHQETSRKGAEHKFKGGLADTEPTTVRLHTAHHLLLAALQKVLGKSVKQRGSNITQERLRIDFTFDRKMTDEEKKKVEDLVNQKINERLDVVKKEIPKAEAEKIGAEMEFGAKYGDMVSVYMIGRKTPCVETPLTPGVEEAFSIEFCGGPHISNTSELGHFRIQKEEAVASGIRRIKAILE